jgi:hypothetical protein
MLREKLPKWKALSVFSSDALSSVGYGPEMIALTLAGSGMVAAGYFPWVFLTILALLVIVTISYTQVARANPGGGGSYSVAKTYLGETPALVAGAALFADYTLTVAVSVASGTEAIVSAFPVLVGNEVAIDIFVLVTVLTIINLRGVREASTVFVFPTYMFVAGVLALIVSGVYTACSGTAPAIPPQSLARQPLDAAMVLLLLRAFANGCSSLTGIEAIANGVTTFKPPAAANAVITTCWMSGLLATMLAGLSFLIMHFHIQPVANVTMMSQVAELTLGRGWLYYFLQITTMLILYLAANTSYNGLPPLLSLMARDGYMPRYLGIRGDRLGFSNGIILLSVVAGALIVGFRGNVERLISLYAIGVFLSFTIAQSGLVKHWYKERGRGWLARAVLNGAGAGVTGTVVLVIAVSKFFYGAWIVLVFIPVMVAIFRMVHHHYEDIAAQLHLAAQGKDPAAAPRGRNIVVVPVSTTTRVVADTIGYAKLISTDIVAIHVSTDEEITRRVQARWRDWNTGIPLTTIDSPYRLLITPLMKYIEELERSKGPDDYITVLIPEFETRKWWHRLLHNQTGWILRTLLILKENVIVATIPFHLAR